MNYKHYRLEFNALKQVSHIGMIYESALDFRGDLADCGSGMILIESSFRQ
jgi:hypothetical protein